MTTTMNHTAKNMSRPLISASEPPVDEAPLFPDDAPPPPAYPALTITTTVIDPDGFTWSVTFNDTPLASAAAILQKRGCRPAGAPVAQSGAPVAHGGPPRCPDHPDRPMKPMQFAGKDGSQWMCTARIGDGYCERRA